VKVEKEAGRKQLDERLVKEHSTRVLYDEQQRATKISPTINDAREFGSGNWIAR
jgi:hypothetical protein